MAKSLSTVTQPESFGSSRELRNWFIKEHDKAASLLLRIYKKKSSIETVTYAEALDQALCFGWIDGQKLPYDEKSWVQKFTPRMHQSLVEEKHYARGAAHPRKSDAIRLPRRSRSSQSRWAFGRCIHSLANATVPTEFIEELARNQRAKQFFSTLKRANLYAIAYRLQPQNCQRQRLGESS